MLREFSSKQSPGEPFRRWYADEYFDLYIWYDEKGHLYGFQLCYDKRRYERAVTWKRGSHLTHFEIHDGEQSNCGHKSSPIFARQSAFRPAELLARFEASSKLLAEEIRDMIRVKMDSGVVSPA